MKTKITQKNNETELCFNPRFYPLNIVKKAANDFKGYCNLSFDGNKIKIIEEKSKAKKISLEIFN
jgi:hypothetical protein